MYTENDLVQIAKRENNKKRNYLVVNRLQGKHIPVKASESFCMFEELAESIKGKYEEKKTLFIGFAETATAIGATVAQKYASMYIQTTREKVDGVEYLFFSEEHSHATEQKLVKTDLNQVYKNIERIIFVEDEVTTGKTILNIISILKKQYPEIKQYAVMSLLNGMDSEALEKYQSEKIELFYLVKTSHNKYEKCAEQYLEDGKYIDATRQEEKCQNYVEYKFSGCLNARRLIDSREYKNRIDKLFQDIQKNIDFGEFRSVLVVGTEECMYPALCVASKLENSCKEVRCHSTTRSPIAVSKETGYPFHVRYQLRSVYDKDRITYLYDIGKYDCVLVVTDSLCEEEEGVCSLINAIQIAGNEKIYIIRWS